MSDDNQGSQSGITQGILIAIGFVVGAIAIANWLFTGEGDVTSIREASVEGQTQETTEPASIIEETSESDGVTKKVVETRAGEKVTRTKPPSKVVTTTSPPASRRSVEITLALLAFAAVALLTGTFYNRVSLIKFPGGEIALTVSDALTGLETEVEKLGKRVITIEDASHELTKVVESVLERVEQLESG